MPGPPAIIAAGAGIAAVTVAVAAAMAIYESEDVRRYTELLRRRVALALHSLGNELDPSQTRDLEPLFNRPEDAEGFLMSRRGRPPGEDGEAQVDADEGSRRRQREELMYWNAMRESRLEAEGRGDLDRSAADKTPTARSRGASFDDFLKPDASGDDGALVINSGTDINANNHDGGLVRRRNVGGAAATTAAVATTAATAATTAATAAAAAAAAAAAGGIAGLSAGLYANPFADDQMIDYDDDRLAEALLAPSPSPAEGDMSDIYSATTPDRHDGENDATPPASPAARPREGAALIDLQSNDSASTVSRTLDFEEEDQRGEGDRGLNAHVLNAEHVAHDDDDRSRLFAVIGAWADGAAGPAGDGRSPSPSPSSSSSTSSHVWPGQHTPDDDFSMADGEVEDEMGASAVHVAAGGDAVGSEAAAEDVLSISEGMFTPASWSEVGSQVSESEPSMRGRA